MNKIIFKGVDDFMVFLYIRLSKDLDRVLVLVEVEIYCIKEVVCFVVCKLENFVIDSMF